MGAASERRQRTWRGHSEVGAQSAGAADAFPGQKYGCGRGSEGVQVHYSAYVARSFGSAFIERRRRRLLGTSTWRWGQPASVRARCIILCALRSGSRCVKRCRCRLPSLGRSAGRRRQRTNTEEIHPRGIGPTFHGPCVVLAIRQSWSCRVVACTVQCGGLSQSGALQWHVHKVVFCIVLVSTGHPAWLQCGVAPCTVFRSAETICPERLAMSWFGAARAIRDSPQRVLSIASCLA